MKQRILILISGGVNSANALLSLLNNIDYAEYDILAHHVKIIHNQDGHDKYLAAKSIVDKLNAVHARKLYFSTTQFDLGGIPNGRNIYTDLEICSFMAGNLVNIDRSIKYLALGLRELDKSGILYPEIFSLLQLHKAGKDITQIIYPNIESAGIKQDLVQEVMALAKD